MRNHAWLCILGLLTSVANSYGNTYQVNGTCGNDNNTGLSADCNAPAMGGPGVWPFCIASAVAPVAAVVPNRQPVAE